jgi:hypothetical protein
MDEHVEILSYLRDVLKRGYTAHAHITATDSRVVRVTGQQPESLIGYGESAHIEHALMLAAYDVCVGGTRYANGRCYAADCIQEGSDEYSSELDRQLLNGCWLVITYACDSVVVSINGVEQVEPPADLVKQVTAVGVAQQWEYRGYVYELKPQPGEGTCMVHCLNPNPSTESHAAFQYARVGKSANILCAITQAVQAPQTEEQIV